MRLEYFLVMVIDVILQSSDFAFIKTDQGSSFVYQKLDASKKPIIVVINKNQNILTKNQILNILKDIYFNGYARFVSIYNSTLKSNFNATLYKKHNIDLN